MLPKEIGPYRIEHKLGSGGMGDVYLAFDSRLDRQVAIKALRTDTTIGTPSAHQTLLSEARAAAALSHQAIAAVFDVIESADQLLLVMEYVPGRTLAALIEGGLGSDDVLNLAVQIADGVAYAHSQGVQHCDLKPANIMVTAL